MPSHERNHRPRTLSVWAREGEGRGGGVNRKDPLSRGLTEAEAIGGGSSKFTVPASW